MISQHIPDSLLARLEKMEQDFIDQFSSYGAAEHALLLGDPRQINLLQSCRSQYRHLICENYPKSRSNVAQLCLSHFIDLPYAKESMDFIILPHVLEFSTEPKTILKEAAECLSQRGTLLLFSLSPFSRFTPLYNKQNALHFSPLSLYTTKQLLTEVGLNVTSSQSFFSVLSTIPPSKFMQFFDKTIMPYLPFLCNAYCVVAQKTTIPPARISLKSYSPPSLAIALEGVCAARSGNP